MENKKILGASSRTLDGIKFRSILEESCYKKLKATKLIFSYESETITLWNGVKPKNLTIYAPKEERKGRFSIEMFLNTRTLLNITYTPDFVIYKGNYKIYVDVKGFCNDTYPIKKKMFLKILEESKDSWNYIFFEPHSVRHIMQMINIIESL